ncbi:hypothetical protein DIURU_003077 [Diutina rugosa]|uniref:HMG box domain-containing protein n=1 Tax=Diutina rugosa TaxID=5481 RepID=A0A642UMP5_DIURU|nr:uncharacterized protein DIURU_003077 [Diutina rugosa]KAA8901828.1 hypothetical protein DIURU_003077 [Diutina rugosa]
MSTAEKKKVTRKKRDPDAPKRSLSAYMFFANENRDVVRSENPGVSFGQVGKLLGEKWKALTSEEKTPYEAKAEADKKRYEKEKAEYAKKQA